MGDIGGKKRILVIDDDEILLSYVETILNDEYDVVVTTSGNSALEYLSQNAVPDLILLDVLMPEVDGFEAFGKIQAIDTLRDIPVIFLTSVDQLEKAQRALAVGAADYITKPFVVANFMNRIRNVIKMYEYKKQRN